MLTVKRIMQEKYSILTVLRVRKEKSFLELLLIFKRREGRMEGVRTANDYFCDYVNNSTPKERYSPDVISLTKEFKNELFRAIPEESDQLYSLMIDAAAEYELCGFKAGFNYAANLMLSLLIAGNKGKPPEELIQIDK